MIEAATTIGLALQACYLSPVTDKLDVWRWVVEALGANHRLVVSQEDPDKKYPLAQYFNVYLYARDSVASSHLKQNLAEMQAWAKEKQQLGLLPNNEDRLFWLLVGLIETGDLEEAEKLLRSTSLKSGDQQMALFIGCHIATELRPLTTAQKGFAKSMCDRLATKVEPYRQQLMHEYGTLLLEYRDGKVIEAEG